MTVIAAAVKDGQVSIAADTQSNFGSLKCAAGYMQDYSKIFKANGNIIAITGWTATTQILEYLADKEPKSFVLNSRWQILDFLLGFHERFKDEFFFETRENNDQPVESNQLDGLIINGEGIFSFASYREVHQHNKFWALGSGRRFAMGAMHALYEKDFTANEIAEAGIAAGAEFDDGCNFPIESYQLKLD